MRNSSCPICHVPIHTILYQAYDRMFGIAGKFYIERCELCKTLTITPKPNKKKLALYYPSQSYYSYSDSNNSILKKLRMYLIEKFYHPTLFSKILFLFVNTVPAIPRMKKDGKIIDIGCGNGETLRTLKKYGWDTYGVDIDAKAIDRAKKSGLENTYIGSYRKLSVFPDGYFDVIRSYHVIEHLDDPALFLMLANKKLKKGGELIIGTPNGQSIVAKIFGSFWYNLDCPRHLFVFSPTSLQTLLTQYEFHISDMRFCSGGGVLGSIQYIIASIRGKRTQWIDNPLLFFFFYPIDWLFDRMGMGDVFVITAHR